MSAHKYEVFESVPVCILLVTFWETFANCTEGPFWHIDFLLPHWLLNPDDPEDHGCIWYCWWTSLELTLRRGLRNWMNLISDSTLYIISLLQCNAQLTHHGMYCICEGTCITAGQLLFITVTYICSPVELDSQCGLERKLGWVRGSLQRRGCWGQMTRPMLALIMHCKSMLQCIHDELNHSACHAAGHGLNC